ncbi:acyl-CoA thioesterase [Natronosalvus caseinilyticus]|uniref:acyl-CoA thioesterase n=1 Tax=Natronosalvus caseinilyticus TaxID=2953747 RepID=UPI0028A8ADA2|nr:thioesterase family protein [Natronosalvus caseinilyticus]
MTDLATDLPFTVDVPIRYRDLDTFSHVNNAVYVTYLESARTAYLEAVTDLSIEDYGFVVANLEIDYERSITMGQDVVVATGTTKLGTSSWTMSYEIYADETRAATGETTLVCVDPETRSSAPMPDSMRQRIVEYEGLEG